MSSFLASLLNAIGQAASSLTISLSSESAAVVFPRPAFGADGIRQYESWYGEHQ